MRPLQRYLTGRATRVAQSALAWGILASPLLAADLGSTKPLTPEIAEASGEARDAMAAIRIPDGWQIDLWAAEPDLANVVAFDIDSRGRVYVCETFRQNRGVTDNRGHDRQWLLADLAAKTVQDRIDYHKRLLGEAAVTYAQHDDRIRRLTDTDGDGKADDSVVFASGFNRLEEGTGAGVLVRGNDVYYTCIPKLWKLIDQDQDGVADERVVLSDGYGVRVAFRGHDMHGLIRGYDGRLYFSIGDRGYHVRTSEGEVLADPASGAVFRCEMDGSGLEVFATGLRNPQELAFNDKGDWFTVDNNSDSGDQARIVHLLQDGDTGWRMYYQYLPDRGPFNRERIWEPQNADQPAAIVPPVANFTDGPSGLAYYPGTGFGDLLRDAFFICDFRGGPSNSGIRSFRVKPDGATYELASDSQPIWTCLATDVAFGPDGALYVSDWVDGWDGLGKGRLYRLTDPKHIDSDIVREVKSLLASDWTKQETQQLVDQLGHQDRRVRLESQWELARRQQVDALIAVASEASGASVPRRHAVWGLGQLARHGESDSKIQSALTNVLADEDPIVVAAAATVAGELGWESAVEPLKAQLDATDARLRYHVIDALGRLEAGDAADNIIKHLVANNRQDPALFHAAAMYLSRAADENQLTALQKHDSSTARLLAVVALRRQKSGAIAGFLQDSDPAVVLEAARAIHDEPIAFATEALAKRIDQPMESEQLVRRVLNANFRGGGAESAVALAKYATRTEAPEAMRIEALDMLSSWGSPDPLDRVLGDYRPLEPRDAVIAAKALEPQIDLLMTAPERVRLKAIDVASQLGIKKIAGALAKQVGQESRAADSRGKALVALARLEPSVAVDMARKIPADQGGPLGLAALTVLADHAAESSVQRFVGATKTGDLKSRQKAWDTLGKLKLPEAQTAIRDAVNAYVAGQLSPEVQLEVLRAAQGRLGDALQQKLQSHRQTIAQEDPLATWLDSLSGGDPQRGSELFFNKTELSCVRCHKVDRAGGEVGPELTTIGKQRDARYLLEAICLPDAKVAEGFETAVIIDIDGRVFSGIVKSETDDYVELMLNDGTQQRILQDEIEARRKGKSSMPADLIKHLTPAELRDLVAYLGSLKVNRRGEGEVE
ncbi:PVC-type heme-binding CxxCH protein [Roseiconus nitratireducens]|nr:PVC-type heme-binding CxxCH protein [Roseiconus nitratireducens]